MTPKQKKLAAALLELASTKFSRHCCNDYAKPADWTQEEWDALIRDMYVANGDPENYEADQKDFYDWWLMSYLGSLLEMEACPPMTPPVPPLTKCTCGHYSTNHISSGNPRCGVIGCKCTFFTLAQADELRLKEQATAESVLSDQLDAVKTAVGGKCGCTPGDCMHDKLRKIVEQHYVPRRLLEERDAEIEALKASVDLVKRQRDDAEHADALESARADEWEQFCRQAEAEADRAATALEMISKLAEGARPRLERKCTPIGNKAK